MSRKKDPNKNIIIKGARTHNLKNIDVSIPKNKLVVVTGVSGSGKSSLVFDTLYAEGQRRYVESLSSYTRQFLSRMDKPDVDYIKGICPAIAIEQTVATRSSRSTVGTLTEVYDYLRVLFARIGKTYSPKSGKIVKRDDVSDVTDYIAGLTTGSKVLLQIPFRKEDGRSFEQTIDLWLQKGFTRLVSSKGQIQHLEDCNPEQVEQSKKPIYLLVDRFIIKATNEEFLNRISGSVQTAFDESGGDCIIRIDGEIVSFSNRFELDGTRFEIPSPQFFNFNNPYGACKRCEGFGSVIGIDENLVIPNRKLSVYEGCVAPWKGEKMGEFKNHFVQNAVQFDFRVHQPYQDLSEREKQLLWQGSQGLIGINDFFEDVERQAYKIQYRVMLSRYRGKTTCPECKGTRLRKDAAFVKIGHRSIIDLVLQPVEKVLVFFKHLELNEFDGKVARRLIYEINSRLEFMLDVGLGYLTLNRFSSTLSGGETQRIHLTRSLGSNLTSSMYILDEPSIGLHPRDTDRLISVLKKLKALGNTVIVVEHEESVMDAADYLIDIGPEAGANGGELVFSGGQDKLRKASTLTAKYLNGDMNVALPDQRRKRINQINLKGAEMHNLKNIEVTIPLNCLTVVTGVSGSGKTTLVKDIFYPLLRKEIDDSGEITGIRAELSGDHKMVTAIELVDQNPIGRSSRSNPVTYVKAYDAIRTLYANQKLSAIRGYKTRHFSFNVEGGRCEECKGEGMQIVEMQFLADVHLVCEHCNGKRFKADVREVKYQGKSIDEVLSLTVAEAIAFFKERKEVVQKLQPLADVGLDYVQLGQSSSTLSGGEAQRIKLASFLSKGSGKESIFFIFDEPTTGLHFHDITKLLKSLNALVEKGHSVLVIEHNLDVIKSADWMIDLGPDGGDEGGFLLYQGEPEGCAKVKKSHTGVWLKSKLN